MFLSFQQNKDVIRIGFYCKRSQISLGGSMLDFPLVVIFRPVAGAFQVTAFGLYLATLVAAFEVRCKKVCVICAKYTDRKRNAGAFYHDPGPMANFILVQVHEFILFQGQAIVGQRAADIVDAFAAGTEYRCQAATCTGHRGVFDKITS